MDLRSQTIFSQVMDLLPRYDFSKCVDRYDGNREVKSFSCWSQLLCMAFAQLTYRESLRDIETCLRVMQSKLYHMGVQGMARNTLANANKVRDWRIYADFAQVLIAQARSLYRGDEILLLNRYYSCRFRVISTTQTQRLHLALILTLALTPGLDIFLTPVIRAHGDDS